MHTDANVSFGEIDLSEDIGTELVDDSSGNAISIDLGRAKKTSPSNSPGPLPFLGRPEMVLRITVTETLAPAAARVVLNLVSNSTSAIAATGRVTKALTSALAPAQLTKGRGFDLRLPKDNDLKRWIGMTFTISGANATAGKIRAEFAQGTPESVGLSAPQSPRRNL